MRLPYPGSMYVEPATGDFVHQVEDLSIPCRGGTKLQLIRYYSSANEHATNQGRTWVFNYQEHLRFEYSGLPNGQEMSNFVGRPGADVYVYPPDEGQPATPVPLAVSVVWPNMELDRYVYEYNGFTPVDPGSRGTLAYNNDGTFSLTLPDRSVHVYGSDGTLSSVTDAAGNAFTYSWTRIFGLGYPQLSSIVDPAGRTLTVETVFVFGNANVSQRTFTDWTGRSIVYNYDPTGGHITDYTDMDGNVTRYEYGSDSAPYLIPGNYSPPYPLYGLYKIVFPNGEFLTNYAAGLRPMWKTVGSQVFGQTRTVTYTYDDDAQTAAVQMGDTNIVYGYDATQNLVSAVDGLGNGFSYGYDANGLLVQSVDPRLGVRERQVDSMARIVSQQDALGNSYAFAYHPTLADRVTQYTKPGPNGDVTYTMHYDGITGYLAAVVNPLGETVAYTYDQYGHMVSMTLQNGKVYTCSYDPVSGDLTAVTDPSGGVGTFVHDAVGRVLSATSPAGRTTSYVWSPGGLLQSITYPDGSGYAFTYDGNRNLVQSLDPAGNATRYEYNLLNEVTRVVDSQGNAVSYAYTERGDLESVTDPIGRVTAYAYDARGRGTSVTNAMGQTTTIAYDPYCGTATVTDPLGRSVQTFTDLLCRTTRQVAADGGTTLYTYNPDGSLATSTDALGHQTTFGYDDAGRTIRVTDPLGNITLLDYHRTGKLKSITDPRGHKTKFDYDPCNRLNQITRRDGTTVLFSHDADGLLVQTVDARGKTWTMVNDVNGRPVARVNPLNVSVQAVYDVMGNLLQSISALGSTTTRTLDALGRLVVVTDSSGNQSTLLYDTVGRVQATIDPLGRGTHLVYDRLNRVISATDAMGGIVSVTYDAGGRMTGVTDPNGNTTSYQYDAVDRVVAEIYPDGSALRWSYDLQGNVVAKTDARGLRTTYAYDAANRLVTVTLPDNTSTTLSYNANGNVKTRVDASGTYAFTYDNEDRPTQITQNGKTYTLSYDADGRLLKLVHADGRQVTYTYDDSGRPASMVTPDYGQAVFTYDADDRRVGVQYANGTSSLAQYDASSRLIRLLHQTSAGVNVTADYRMAYDPVGNMVSITDAGSPLWAYGYDDLDRLVSATDQQGSTSWLWTYDRLGNRLTETVNGVTTAAFYNALNQLVQQGTTRLFWDENGNLIQKVTASGATDFRYDSRDRLVRVDLPGGKSIDYGYDQRGRLITRTDATGTTTFEWNGWLLERERPPVGPVARNFYNGTELVSIERNDQNYSVHTDHLGAVRAVTDRFQNTVAAFSYDAWGNVLSVTDNVPGGMPYQWVGGAGVRWDSGAKMYYMRNRFYDPTIHRFVSRDAVRSNNLYVYAAGNPVKSIDPTGNDVNEINAGSITLAQADLSTYFAQHGLLYKVDPSSTPDDFFYADPPGIETETKLVNNSECGKYHIQNVYVKRIYVTLNMNYNDCMAQCRLSEDLNHYGLGIVSLGSAALTIPRVAAQAGTTAAVPWLTAVSLATAGLAVGWEGYCRAKCGMEASQNGRTVYWGDFRFAKP